MGKNSHFSAKRTSYKLAVWLCSDNDCNHKSRFYDLFWRSRMSGTRLSSRLESSKESEQHRRIVEWTLPAKVRQQRNLNPSNTRKW
jgi:hypothetical protein